MGSRHFGNSDKSFDASTTRSPRWFQESHGGLKVLEIVTAADFFCEKYYFVNRIMMRVS